MNIPMITGIANAGRFGTAALFDSLSSPARFSANNDAFDLLLAQKGNQATSSGIESGASSISGRSVNTALPSVAGRNTLLANPESAYRMMSLINRMDVSWKGEFAELSEMKSFLMRLEDSGANLGTVDPATSDAQIKSRLQGFVDQYNQWDARFDADMEAGGLLAGTQAAQVSRYELRQSIENRFNGARDGLQGLNDLGVSIDPATGQASFDASKLDAVLADNRAGAVHTLQEFGANFARSADLLNADGNLVPNRLNNLERVLHYITDNKRALQQEFGTGDAAKPDGLVAQALAAYERMAKK